jgi:polyphenol oxidase
MISLTKDKAMLGYELFSPYPNIACFVTTRSGGCSSDAYGTFNCSPFSGDEAEKVHRNQQKLCRSLPQSPHELIIPFQTHGVEVRIINKDFIETTDGGRRELLQNVDAVVTAERGYCICVSTADCIPILLYDRKNEVVAAIHAGWRGTVGAIVTGTLAVMKETFGSNGQDILACVGPGISLTKVMTCRESRSGIMKRESIISTCGKQIVCNCLSLGYLPSRYKWQASVRISITMSSSRLADWVLNQAVFYPESC